MRYLFFFEGHKITSEKSIAVHGTMPWVVDIISPAVLPTVEDLRSAIKSVEEDLRKVYPELFISVTGATPVTG